MLFRWGLFAQASGELVRTPGNLSWFGVALLAIGAESTMVHAELELK